MLVETATERKERLAKGISVAEATKNSPMEAVVIEPTDDELTEVKAELDELCVSYSPRAGLKSLRKKLEEAKEA